ncbi:MAG: type II toxin-antitoxin system HipA family toxin [Thiobacillus sp.]|nr:type II toxin-antitoxin system HipA family toxin [Thiobacillus sp.]
MENVALQVLLDDLAVGRLELDRNEAVEFRLLESYKTRYPRPVLGQIFLDDLDKVHRSQARVPPWFSNLLPEGPLRELIAQQAGVHSSREFFLLAHLGADLPGAVRIVAEGDLLDIGGRLARSGEPESDEWHFSLAGVQLKFSARKADRGLTVPVTGRGGDWIVKLPDARYPKVPENEYATLRWARMSGIEVPEIELVDVRDISGLPDALSGYHERHALAIRRFDRTAEGKRLHMEDFAQILGLYPEEKYRKYNYETLASLVHALAGESGLDAFIRRLVFVVVSGNGDAHHKNWSLLYPDGVQARLSPAYDLVSTVSYKFEDTLALNLARSKRWQDVDLAAFRRLARKIGVDEASMVTRVQVATDAIMSAWREHGADFGYDRSTRDTLAIHFERIPLLSGMENANRAEA